MEAQSPMAIVIPSKGSSVNVMLREGDISWHDFLERAMDFKYALIILTEEHLP